MLDEFLASLIRAAGYPSLSSLSFQRNVLAQKIPSWMQVVVYYERFVEKFNMH